MQIVVLRTGRKANRTLLYSKWRMQTEHRSDTMEAAFLFKILHKKYSYSWNCHRIFQKEKGSL